MCQARPKLRLGGAERERGGAALVEAGNGRFAVHADAFGRRHRDLRVPRYTPIEDGAALDETTHVRNSAARTNGGALGGVVDLRQRLSRRCRSTPTTAATAWWPNPTC